MKVIIAGGSGFLGINLANYLSSRDYQVTIISRSAPLTQGKWTHVHWNGYELGDWVEELEGADVLVNLAGRSVDCIKTPENCDEILRSRTETTKILGQALRKLASPPLTWVQMSTAHIYGDSIDRVCNESSCTGYGLAPFVGEKWESSHNEALLPNMRSVILRTSFVLGRDGGALKTLSLITKLGLGGKVGSGNQGISWLHEEDMNRIFEHAITNDNMRGVFLATAPHPVSNKAFMSELRKSLGVPFGLPAYSFLVKIGARYLFRTDPELALYGRYCVSSRLKEEGFDFKYKTLDEAFKDLHQIVI